MFFEGSLREGIAAALQGNKTVVCFVADDGDDSQLWENDYLKDSTLSPHLNGAVVLKLQAASEEAGHLAALFPLPKTPTLVMIRNGQLKEYVAVGTSKDDFLSRVTAALDTSASTSTPQPSSTQPGIAQQAQPSNAQTEQASPVNVTKQQDKPTPEDQKSASQKHTEDQKSASQKHTEDQKKSASQKHAEALRRKREQEDEERHRILRRIERDKRERYQREHERRQARAAAQENQAPKPSETVLNISNFRPAGSAHRMTALQVRLLDGSTIRSPFPITGTLRKNVRPWIDQERKDGKTPYSFKVILSPLPNKTIDSTEEEQSLRELGLTPSATLVLTSVPVYADAYRPGPINTLLGFITLFWTWLVSLVSGPARPETSEETSEEASTNPATDGSASSSARPRGSPREGMRIRRLHDIDRRDQQLYNGNSLNFQSRPDDDKDG